MAFFVYAYVLPIQKLVQQWHDGCTVNCLLLSCWRIRIVECERSLLMANGDLGLVGNKANNTLLVMMLRLFLLCQRTYTNSNPIILDMSKSRGAFLICCVPDR